MSSDSDAGAANEETRYSDEASSEACAEADAERPRVVRHRDPSQLSSEERTLLNRYARDRPPHWS